jgi:hypothetical protein
MERQYTPKVDSHFKMKEWTDYTSRGINVWAHLKTIAVIGETVSFQVLNGDKPTEYFSACPLSAVNPPIGWESRYTIYCNLEQAEKIVSNWFTRGIVVRTNHCIGDSAGSVFQPLDNSSTPHWKYPECTDVIPADDCPKLFRVVSVIEEEITSATLGYPSEPACKHCQGTGRRSLAELANIRKETIEETRALLQNGTINLDGGLDAGETFRCHCHFGALSRMKKTDRAKLFKTMRADGWQTEYVPYAGGFWTRRKETVIHNWKEA